MNILTLREIEIWQIYIRRTFTKCIALGFYLHDALWYAWNVYITVAIEETLLDLQQQDIFSFFYYRTALFNYCRDSGKTWIGSHLVIFFQLIGYRSMWLAASRTQLMAAFLHWKTNPFVVPFKPSIQRQSVDIYYHGLMEVRVATENNVRGPHVPIVFYDEVARMEKDVWRASLPIAGQFKYIFRMYLSTPVLHSLFHELSKLFATFTHTYLEFPFLNHTDIEAQKPLMNLNLWEQEWLAKFTVLEGKVFYNIHRFTGPPPDCTRIRQGVDLHGRKPHVLVRVGEFGGKLYFLGEWEFQVDNPADQKQLNTFQKMFPTEVEDNDEGSEYLFLLPQASRMRWTAITKYEQIGYLLRIPLLMNPQITPHCVEEFDAMQYDEKGKIDTGDLDYGAAGIHAGQGGTFGVVDLPSQNRSLYTRRRG